jgi:hypothetical protein
MQTDLHRVIRTQKLTDDHCQVRCSYSISVVDIDDVLLVLHLPDPARSQIYTQRWHRTSGPKASQPPRECQL